MTLSKNSNHKKKKNQNERYPRISRNTILKIEKQLMK